MCAEEIKKKLVECNVTITYADGKKVEWTTTPQAIAEILLRDTEAVKMIIKKRTVE